jgi:hypothetical protein
VFANALPDHPGAADLGERGQGEQHDRSDTDMTAQATQAALLHVSSTKDLTFIST